METIIDVRGVSKRYDRVTALQSVSFQVGKGEIFGLIGPDGSGKTSLFRILTSLLLPDAGAVTFCGHDVLRDLRFVRSNVGYMPGSFSLYPDLTVEENLNFFATLFGTTVAENYALVKDIYSQIEPFRKRRAGRLSGGMKQKLALSCALIHKPLLLLLDEPTTGVDPVSRKEFWDMLLRLKAEGITIIVATPYLDEIKRCDRMVLLREGTIKDTGTPEEMLARHGDLLNPAGLQREEKQQQREAVIEVRNLTKKFGDFTAVDHISLDVYRGEIFGFLGANGAGKTTAMRMLSGLSYPTSGEGKVAGFDIAREQEKIKQRIGYMSQRFSLYDDLTVRENMRLFGGIYGVPRREIAERTAAALEKIGLTAEADARVGALPLGWKQKLAFTVATFHRPEIVFLDEPTGGVDAATRRKFWAYIYEAADEGMTVFVTTHYMDEAEYCNRVSIMVDGQVRALDTPEALKQKYGAPDMDTVFRLLAREAKRGE